MSHGRDPTLLGTVQDVSGSTVRIALDYETLSGLTFFGGQGYRVGQIGAFVRIPLGYFDLYGIVSQVGAGAAPQSGLEQFPGGQRWMTVQLAGQARRNFGFERGISQYPTIGDPAHIVTEDDLHQIYGRAENPAFVRVGSLAASSAIPALLDINRLITRHSAVVGATGSGKSTTVASLMHSLSNPDRYPSARVIMIDVHGEYAKALRGRSDVFRIGANSRFSETELQIPYWALTFDELISISIGDADETTRSAYADKVLELKRDSFEKNPINGVELSEITVDTPVPFSIRRLWWDFHCLTRATHYEDGKSQSVENWALDIDDDGIPTQPGSILDVIPPKFRPPKDDRGDTEKIRLSQSRLNIGRSVDILAARLRDKRLSFLFSPGQWACDLNEGAPDAALDSLLSSWLGDRNPVSILDLSGVPPTIQSDIVGALMRVLFESLFWAKSFPEGGKSRPLLVVLEEAHSYLGEDSKPSARDAVKRIAKEGRKYGLGLMIVSQRPAEIHQTILSQCGTLIALRLSNSADRGHVTSAVSDNLEGLLASLPILRTGEAIIVGEAVNLPIRAQIAPPSKDRRPESEDPLVVHTDADDEDTGGVGGWNTISPNEDYARVVQSWRKQNPKLLHSTDEEEESLNWISVNSTNVSALAYDDTSQTLSVEFKAGNRYQYFDVPRSTFEECLNASSVGRYFNANIKNRFRYARE